MDESPDNGSDTFGNESAELQRWPYVTNLIDDTLDHELIEGKGKQLLFQALSNQTLLAFVGSGLSAAYGRLTWKEWQERQVDRLSQIAEAFVLCATESRVLIECLTKILASEKTEYIELRQKLGLAPSEDRRAAFLDIKLNEIKFRSREIEGLSKTLSLLKNAPSIPGGEPAPVVFQAAEKLKEALGRNDDLFAGKRDEDHTKDPSVLVEAMVADAIPGFSVQSSAGPAENVADLVKNILSLHIPATEPDAAVRAKNFCEQHKRYEKALRSFLRLIQAEEVSLSFSDLTKVLMVDECAQAEGYLWQATLYKESVGRAEWSKEHKSKTHYTTPNNKIRRTPSSIKRDNLRRKVKGIRDDPERFWSLGYFRSDSIRQIAIYILAKHSIKDDAFRTWGPMLRRIIRLTNGNAEQMFGQRREHVRQIISPTHRFVFEMMVDLLEDPYADLRISNRKRTGRSKRPHPTFTPIKNTDFLSRHSVIDTELDPIDQLMLGMGIKRYLTTNYDMEIERFFQDRGYRKYESAHEEVAEGTIVQNGDRPGVYRVDELGGIFKDHSFDRDNASDLVAFSVDDADADAHIFHLHGRATDSSKIVVTERDYMDLYLRNDHNRDSVDESIRLAFSGNPLFFVGLGMQEADVLRPLRQFMSDKDRAIDRTAIVLYAADKPKATRASTATGLYLRYGVHTIFFGSGRIHVSGTGTTSDGWVKIDWLHYTIELINELRSINREIQEVLEYAVEMRAHLANSTKKRPEKRPKGFSTNWSGPDLLRRVNDALAKISADAREKDLTRPLNTLLGLAPDRSLNSLWDFLCDSDDAGNKNSRRLAPIYFIPDDEYSKSERISVEEAKAHGDQFLQFECFAIFEILRMTCMEVPHLRNVQDVLTKTSGNNNWSEEQLAEIKEALPPSLRDIRARMVALDGLQTAVMTGALCASLDALTSEWQTWWTHWRQSPPHRVPRFERRLPENFNKVFRDPPEADKPDGVAQDVVPIVYPPLRYVRHLLNNEITDLKHAEHYKESVELQNFYPKSWRARTGPIQTPITTGSLNSEREIQEMYGRPPTGVRAFDTFIDAVATESKRLPWFDATTGQVDNTTSFAHRPDIISTKQPMSVTPTRIGANPLDLRRTYLIAAKRGLGKGTFFSAFFSTLGLSSYIQAAWPISRHSRHPYFVSAFFVNFSFSSEIASSYDMLIDAMIETNVALSALPEWEGQNADRHIRSNLQKLAECPGQNIQHLLARHWEQAAKLREVAINLFDQRQADAPDLTDLTEIMCRNADTYAHGQESSLTSLQIYKHAIRETLSGLPRLEILEHLFKAFCRLSKVVRIHRNSTTHRPRLLLVINALELLHYAGGLPKNREIEEFLRILSSEAFSRVPLDVVFISSEQNIGEIFVEETPFLKSYRNAYRAMQDKIVGTEFRDPSVADDGTTPTDYKMHFVSIERHDLSVTGRSNVALRQQGSGIRCLSAEAADSLPIQDRGHVHFGREASSERILVDNFKPLAIFLFMLDLENRLHEIKKNIGTGNKSIRQNVDKYITLIEKFNRDKSTHQDIFDETSSQDRWNTLCKLYTDKCKEFLDLIAIEDGNGIPVELKRLIEEHKGKPPGSPADIEARTTQLLLARYDPDAPTANHKVIREWRDIGHSIRQNRYCMTILLAAAQRIALGQRTIRDGAVRAEAFIRRVADEAATASSSRVEQVVLDKVLDAHEQFHILSKPRNDLELQMLVMRHLAVIGAPCSVDVLVRMPDIRRYFDAILRDNPESRHDMLGEALDSMVRHGLVFRLHPHPRLVQLHDRLNTLGSQGQQGNDAKKNDNAHRCRRYYGKTNPNEESRYTLHRLTQRHVIQKMGSGPHEYIEINSFAPSTYASMPSELPRLTHEAYTFLNTLVATLSQYPDHPRTSASNESWHLGSAPLSTRVQALRAALCVVRSTFSVAVVSRFEDYKHLGTEDEEMDRGYFEAYRVQVRWIIRKAWELLDDKDTGSEYDPAQEWQHINALYRDEIAWLYNECGLICLVQGNLIDAVALLRQAIRFNRAIEGPIDGGAQHNRISLNLAIVQIERGRLSAARRRLESIQETELQSSGRRGRLWFVVHGYLGFISHLSGDREAASRRYREALAILEIYKDRRACSIFSRHLGDLERTQGNLEEARRLINAAISFAEAGGHEDLHKKARLSLIRLDIEEIKASPSGAHARPHSQSLVTRIGVIEDYAHVMEMPTLLCEALHARASFLADHGETALAGTLLTRAMAIAKRNGMALRLNRSMTLYASVLSARGLPDQARKLLFGCLEMAKRHGNQIEIERIEAAFDQI